MSPVSQSLSELVAVFSFPVIQIASTAGLPGVIFTGSSVFNQYISPNTAPTLNIPSFSNKEDYKCRIELPATVHSIGVTTVGDEININSKLIAYGSLPGNPVGLFIDGAPSGICFAPESPFADIQSSCSQIALTRIIGQISIDPSQFETTPIFTFDPANPLYYHILFLYPRIVFYK